MHRALFAGAQRRVIVIDDLELERNVEPCGKALEQVVLDPGGLAFGVHVVGIGAGNDGGEELAQLHRIDAARRRRVARASGQHDEYRDRRQQPEPLAGPQ